jgi:hypothetical protein
MLRACDGRSRIHLDHAQPMDGLDERRRSGRGQQLARHREPARASSGETDGVGHAVKTTRAADGLPQSEGTDTTTGVENWTLPALRSALAGLGWRLVHAGFLQQQPLHEPLVAQGAQSYVETPPQPNEVDGLRC